LALASSARVELPRLEVRRGAAAATGEPHEHLVRGYQLDVGPDGKQDEIEVELALGHGAPRDH
jgi:hypothetical protein